MRRRINFQHLLYHLIFVLLFFGAGSLLRAQNASEDSEREPAASKKSTALKIKKSSKKDNLSSAAGRANSKSKKKTDRAKKRDSNAQNFESEEPDLGGLIQKIKIEGNKRIESSAIRAKLNSKEGTARSLQIVREDIRTLFGMGYFQDITVDEEEKGGSVELTFKVSEKPSIGEILIVGQKAIEEDDLRQGLGVKAFEILDHSKLQKAVEKIEKMYEDKGFFLARVRTEIEPMTVTDSVRVRFIIEENDKVLVQKITFVGNEKIPDQVLRKDMLTQEKGFFHRMSNSGSYKEEVFERDVQLLTFIYYNKGYVRAKVEQPQVQVSSDKKSIYITIRIQEGDLFTVGKIGFDGDLLFSDQELVDATSLKSGEDFSWSQVQKDQQELQAKYGDLGYAFVNVIPRIVTHDNTKTVDVTYEFEKGDKVYFGQINVVGNTRTRDKVIRRELKIREGELYNETRKRESMAKITQLGFFEDVRFNTKTNPERPDVLDIEIAVKERSTGTVNVQAGYATTSKFILGGQLSQKNWDGRGQAFSGTINYSADQSEFNLSFNDPYFFDSKWSFGFDLYNQTRKILTYYDELKRGGSIQLGHPLAEDLNGILRYKLDDTNLTLRDGDPAIYPVETANGKTSSATFILEYDTRNDRFSPSEGFYNSASLEYAGLGGDLAYTKGLVSLRYFRKIVWDVVWRHNFAYGLIQPNTPGGVIPFNQMFLLGGAFSLRGYTPSSIGTRKFSQLACSKFPTTCHSESDPGSEKWRVFLPFGGSQELVYNMEFEFPLIKEVGMKGVVFYDIGNAQDQLDFSALRSDFGFGLRWFSPIGPLRLEWGFPIDRKPSLGEGNYQFFLTIGSPF